MEKRNDIQQLIEITDSQAEMHSSFLSEVSYRLSNALTDQECFQKLAELIVPAFADLATIAVLTNQGEIRRVALAHKDPTQAARMSVLLTDFPVQSDDSYSIPTVIHTGKPDYDFDADSHVEEYVKRYRNPQLGALYKSLRIRSRVCVPLVAHGQILGSLWTGTTETGRKLNEEDLRLAEKVAARAAQAVFHQIRYSNVSRDLERLKIEMDLKNSCISQIRHDVLSVLTTASLVAQVLSRGRKLEETPALAKKILNSIERAADILRKTRGI
jgi:GAF domain-containing protein